MFVLLANIRKLSIIIIPYSLNKQKEVLVLQVKVYRLSTRIKNRRGSALAILACLASGSSLACLATGFALTFSSSLACLASGSALATSSSLGCLATGSALTFSSSLACLLCRNIVAVPTVTPYFSSK